VRELQEWMYGAITSAEWPADTSRVVDASRLAIYRDMYPIRMQEAMAVDYPAMAQFLGEHDFNHLIDHYTEDHPSQSYTLNRLGDSFPAFLKERDPFLSDLARLEMAMTQVFDEEESCELDPAAFGSIGPDTRLKVRPAVRIAAFDYPVNEFFQSFRDDEELVEPDPQRSWTVFYRRDFGVFRMELEEKAYDFLFALIDGATIVEAIDATGATQDELFAWFRNWSEAGIFGGIE